MTEKEGDDVIHLHFKKISALYRMGVEVWGDKNGNKGYNLGG